MGGRDKPGHEDSARIIARQLALAATIGMATGLAGCGAIPSVHPAAPQPVAYAHGRNPCVEYAEDIFGRRYCRRHYAD